MPPNYTWIITKPDGTTEPPMASNPGTGAVATITADQPGTYSCTFTATADRECPPFPHTMVPAATANVIEPDIDGDADHDAVIDDEGPDDDWENTLPGIIVLCNQDDDDLDGVADNIDNIVNTNGDAADLTLIVIRKMTSFPAVWTVKLTLQNPAIISSGIEAGDVV